jgi:hypothetical protein
MSGHGARCASTPMATIDRPRGQPDGAAEPFALRFPCFRELRRPCDVQSFDVDRKIPLAELVPMRVE